MNNIFTIIQYCCVYFVVTGMFCSPRLGGWPGHYDYMLGYRMEEVGCIGRPGRWVTVSRLNFSGR